MLFGVIGATAAALSAQTAATQKPPAVVVPAGRPTVFLWPNGAPGLEARKDEPEQINGETVLNVHNPSIVVFLPRKEINTGVGLILAPGGGHTSLWIMHEGFNPAQALVDKGIAVFVVAEDASERGLDDVPLVEGVRRLSRAEVPALIGRYGRVWQW